jgi:NAD(P)-dependent dehydrogenase (short-subunit alcohol dehydrogenase family)
VDDLQGRIAVVTGAGSGIGRGVALALARSGADVVVADRDSGRVASVVEELTALGSDSVGVVTDVSDASSVERLADAAYARFGRVHVLVNNAGVASTGTTWASPLDEWARVVGVNMWGPVNGVRSFVPRMLSGGQPGHVVNTSSMAGLIAATLTGAYTTSKHAVVGLSKCLRAELQGLGAPIGVSVVCPGGVATAIMDDELVRTRETGRRLPADAQEMFDHLKQTVDGGISGEAAGEIVTDAIRANRFWVFPNSEDYLALLEPEHDEMRSCVSAQK